MTVKTSYPGVYVTEIPSGSRTVVGVATSITAFVGSATRGPADAPTTIFSLGDFERTFGPLSRDHGLGYLVRDFYLNGGGEAIVVRAVNADTAVTAHGDVGGLELEATGPGAWGNALKVQVEHPTVETTAIAAAQGVQPTDLFTLRVQEGDDESTRESYVNVTVADGPRRVDLVLAGSRLVRVAGTLPGSRPNEVADMGGSLAAGADGDAIVEADYGDETATTGLWSLLRADLVNILCLAPATPSSDVPTGVWPEALSFCVRRRAFLLVDPPSTATDHPTLSTWVTGSGIAGTGARNAALFFPRLRYGDPARGGAMSVFAPSGAVAGVMARTDADRGVWKSPAGLEAGLVGVNGLEHTLTDDENGLFNPDGLNNLRTFRGVGSVVWGSRTMRGADILGDEYRYIAVRRLALFLEETLYRNTQWVVFEPNDEPLWAQIRTSLGAFMQDLFRRGAFQGRTPRDAYFVQCDSDTTTQYDIDRGVVNIKVGFAPLKPAEFVVISIQQKAPAAV
ncbi:phage tail sheath family protein [Cellulomonas sp. ICMP 17802]|uniref:phage tail sheath family protein n=1 Tax=Cellulomonas sp. ICMP 17802 TaxID=3239199 RepID=UPI00351B15A6